MREKVEVLKNDANVAKVTFVGGLVCFQLLVTTGQLPGLEHFKTTDAAQQCAFA